MLTSVKVLFSFITIYSRLTKILKVLRVYYVKMDSCLPHVQWKNLWEKIVYLWTNLLNNVLFHLSLRTSNLVLYLREG